MGLVDMKEKIFEILSYFPFVLSVNGNVRLNGARIIEGIIIAALAGLLSGYVAVSELKVEMIYIKDQMKLLETQVDKLDNRLYEHNKYPGE
jgi:hypothetical protein